jgi:hypothetical protein
MESKNIDIATINAMNDLPVIARLEFVRNIIFDRGGDKHSIPQDSALITAKEVLDGVIKALRNNPTLSRLNAPEP